jgi:hypothetical protein
MGMGRQGRVVVSIGGSRDPIHMRTHHDWLSSGGMEADGLCPCRTGGEGAGQLYGEKFHQESRSRGRVEKLAQEGGGKEHVDL